ncbi:uncharacterized protein LOC125542396 isoform X2 [Triticum urartu]|uniref:uncharacterized protein LOC125542396 isoform X2 n=1 Tax=Triticum urartu TaxID=4572 RepID=UPI002042EDC0|nr:uncharacterized protein LOC125542396 isoform X2 [Triticum urartu]
MEAGTQPVHASSPSLLRPSRPTPCLLPTRHRLHQPSTPHFPCRRSPHLLTSSVEMPPPNHRISPAGLFGAPHPPPSQCSLTSLPSRCPPAVLLALTTPPHEDEVETAAGARIAGSPHFAGQQPPRAFPDPFAQQQQRAPQSPPCVRALRLGVALLPGDSRLLFHKIFNGYFVKLFLPWLLSRRNKLMFRKSYFVHMSCYWQWTDCLCRELREKKCNLPSRLSPAEENFHRIDTKLHIHVGAPAVATTAPAPTRHPSAHFA